MAGAWDEFEALVRDDPSIARDIGAWIVPADDPDRAAYARAKNFATLVASDAAR
jgi:hypothetical protein